MATPTHNLAIGLTNRCPLRCDFCCVPPGRGDLPDETVRRVVGEAVELRTFRSVGFTGGEPLLRWRLVAECGLALASSGISWGLTTGVGWARDVGHVTHVVDAMAEAGVDHVTVSADPSHLAFAKKELVEAFVAEVAQRGVRRVTVSVTSRKKLHEPPIVVPDSSNVRVDYHYVAPVGYASGEGACATAGRFSLASSFCPMQRGLTLSVWPDGTVYPCCSTYVVNKEANLDLSVGNVEIASLREILAAALDDPYLAAIREIGFAGMLVLSSTDPVWSEAFGSKGSPVLDSCHLCSRLAETKGAVPRLRAALNNVAPVAL